MSGQNDSFTKIMLHFDGADAGTSFPDSSLLNNTFTAHGNVQTHTTSFAGPKFGTASGKFDGTTDYITCPDVAALRPGSGDFTVDFWIRYNAGSVNHTVFEKGYTASNAMLIQSDTSASPKLQFFSAGGVNVVTETTGSATGAYVHKAIVRSGSTVTIYSGGTANGTGSNSTNINDTSQISIGARGSDGTFSVNGNIDELRFSVGIARWTSNFTPPTSTYATELEATAGSFAETGGAAVFGLALSVQGGSYAFTGSAITFLTKLTGATGAYVVSGNAATFKNTFITSAGSYLVTGNAAVLTPSITALSGSYSVTGSAAAFFTRMAASTGSYIVTGNDATFARNHEAWFPRPFDADTWTARTKQDEIWTPAVKQAEAWTTG